MVRRRHNVPGRESPCAWAGWRPPVRLGLARTSHMSSTDIKHDMVRQGRVRRRHPGGTGPGPLSPSRNGRGFRTSRGGGDGVLDHGLVLARLADRDGGAGHPGGDPHGGAPGRDRGHRHRVLSVDTCTNGSDESGRVDDGAARGEPIEQLVHRHAERLARVQANGSRGRRRRRVERLLHRQSGLGAICFTVVSRTSSSRLPSAEPGPQTASPVVTVDATLAAAARRRRHRGDDVHAARSDPGLEIADRRGEPIRIAGSVGRFGDGVFLRLLLLDPLGGLSQSRRLAGLDKSSPPGVRPRRARPGPGRRRPRR